MKRSRTFRFLLSTTVIIESGCTFCVPYFFYLYLIAARYQHDVIVDLTFDSTTISALRETIVRRSWKIRASVVVGSKKMRRTSKLIERAAIDLWSKRERDSNFDRNTCKEQLFRVVTRRWVRNCAAYFQTWPVASRFLKPLVMHSNRLLER